VKFTLILIAAAMLLTACGRPNKPLELSNDAKLGRKIEGTWLTSNGIITFSPDGSSSARFTNGIKELTYETKWEIKGTNIIITVTNVIARNTTEHEAIGTVEQLNIVYLDETNLVWEDDVSKFRVSLKRKQP
jgi:hypothetical protein